MAFRTARFRGHSAPLIATVGLLVVVLLLSLITSSPHFIQVKANPSISIDADNLSPGDVRFFCTAIRRATGFGFCWPATREDELRAPSMPAVSARCIGRAMTGHTATSSAGIAG